MCFKMTKDKEHEKIREFVMEHNDNTLNAINKKYGIAKEFTDDEYKINSIVLNRCPHCGNFQNSLRRKW